MVCRSRQPSPVTSVARDNRHPQLQSFMTFVACDYNICHPRPPLPMTTVTSDFSRLRLSVARNLCRPQPLSSAITLKRRDNDSFGVNLLLLINFSAPENFPVALFVLRAFQRYLICLYSWWEIFLTEYSVTVGQPSLSATVRHCHRHLLIVLPCQLRLTSNHNCNCDHVKFDHIFLYRLHPCLPRTNHNVVGLSFVVRQTYCSHRRPVTSGLTLNQV